MTARFGSSTQNDETEQPLKYDAIDEILRAITYSYVITLLLGKHFPRKVAQLEEGCSPGVGGSLGGRVLLILDGAGALRSSTVSCGSEVVTTTES